MLSTSLNTSVKQQVREAQLLCPQPYFIPVRSFVLWHTMLFFTVQVSTLHVSKPKLSHLTLESALSQKKKKKKSDQPILFKVKLLLLQLYKNYSNFSQQMGPLCSASHLCTFVIIYNYKIFPIECFYCWRCYFNKLKHLKVGVFFQKTTISIKQKRYWKPISTVLRFFAPFYSMEGKWINLGHCIGISFTLLQSLESML